MNKICRLGLTIISVGLLLTGCNKKTTNLTPSFTNYTSADRKEKTYFDETISAKDKELSFKDIQYNNTSFILRYSSDYSKEDIYQYDGVKTVYKTITYDDRSKIYNHLSNAYYVCEDSNSKGSQPGETINSTYSSEIVYQIYDQKVVVANTKNKLYQVVDQISSYQTFGGYISAHHGISETYLQDGAESAIEYLNDYTLSDVSLIYYVKNNVYTIGLSYRDRTISESSDPFSKIRTVNAVFQMTAKKKFVSFDGKIEITEVEKDFTDEYKAEHKIDYQTHTSKAAYEFVSELSIGGLQTGEPVNIKNYSLGIVVE